MHTTIERKELLRALKAVKPAVPAKSTLPILQYVRLYQNGRLQIEATNLDIRVSVMADGYGEDGLAVLSYKGLLAAVKAIKENEITIATTNTGANVAGASLDDSIFVPTLPLADYPDGPGEVGGQFEIADAASFLQAARFVLPNTYPDLDRPILTHALWQNDKLVATDGYRIAIAHLIGTGSAPILMPAGALRAALGLFSATGTLTISYQVQDGGITRGHITDGTNSVWFNGTEGRFPDWTKIIVHDPTTRFDSLPENWPGPVELALVNNRNLDHILPEVVKFTPTGGGLRVTDAKNNQVGNIGTKQYTDNAPTFALNGHFILTQLPLFADRFITVTGTDENHPWQFQQDDPTTGRAFTWVVMPIHTQR